MPSRPKRGVASNAYIASFVTIILRSKGPLYLSRLSMGVNLSWSLRTQLGVPSNKYTAFDEHPVAGPISPAMSFLVSLVAFQEFFIVFCHKSTGRFLITRRFKHPPLTPLLHKSTGFIVTVKSVCFWGFNAETFTFLNKKPAVHFKIVRIRATSNNTKTCLLEFRRFLSEFARPKNDDIAFSWIRRCVLDNSFKIWPRPRLVDAQYHIFALKMKPVTYTVTITVWAPQEKSWHLFHLSYNDWIIQF